MSYSDRLAEACIANGADPAEVGSWPDFKRETYLYDYGAGLPPKVDGKPYYLELAHEGFSEFDDAGWEWRDPGKFVIGCFATLGELVDEVREFDADDHLNTNDGCPPEFKLTVVAGQAREVKAFTCRTTGEVQDWRNEVDVREGDCIVMSYEPLEPSRSQRGLWTSD